MSLFSTVKVESLTSVVATPGRGGEGGLQGAGVNGETEHWPERTLTVEQLLCLHRHPHNVETNVSSQHSNRLTTEERRTGQH